MNKPNNPEPDGSVAQQLLAQTKLFQHNTKPVKAIKKQSGEGPIHLDYLNHGIT